MPKTNFRTASLVLLVLILSSSLVLASPPTDAGTFPNNWYSDASNIGYFPHNNSSPWTSLKVAFARTSGCGMSSANLATIGGYGFDNWATNLILSRTSGTQADYHINQICITRSEATALGFPSNADAGAATWTSYTTPYYAKTNTNQTMLIHQISKTDIYYVWDATTTASYSLDKWKAIAVHENGHALGYTGHDVNSTSVNKAIMHPHTNVYFDTWVILSTQVRDRTHINNTYSKF